VQQVMKPRFVVRVEICWDGVCQPAHNYFVVRSRANRSIRETRSWDALKTAE
jgi:hypothetical protein